MKFKMLDRLIILRNPIKIYSLPNLMTWGITNRVDGEWLLFLDYDKVEYKSVTEDVRYLQNHFKAGTAMTRISSLFPYKNDEVGNYHVFFFRHFTLPQVKKIMAESNCDNKFKKGYQYQERSWVLRLGEKIDMRTGDIKKPFSLLKDIIICRRSPGPRQRPACNALMQFFEKLDGYRPANFVYPRDNHSIKDINLIEYPTR